jgi:hypothetical protein
MSLAVVARRGAVRSIGDVDGVDRGSSVPCERGGREHLEWRRIKGVVNAHGVVTVMTEVG